MVWPSQTNGRRIWNIGEPIDAFQAFSDKGDKPILALWEGVWPSEKCNVKSGLCCIYAIIFDCENVKIRSLYRPKVTKELHAKLAKPPSTTPGPILNLFKWGKLARRRLSSNSAQPRMDITRHYSDDRKKNGLRCIWESVILENTAQRTFPIRWNSDSSSTGPTRLQRR